MMKHISVIKITGYTGFFLTLAYLFFFLRQLDLSLTYYWQQTIPLSFGEALQYPGDISELLGERFLELLTRPFTGFIAVVLLVSVIFFSLYIPFRRSSSSPVFYPLLLVALAPYILLLVHYRLPVGLVISVPAGILLGGLQSLYSPANRVARFIYWFIAGIIVYLIAGTPGLLVLIQVIIIQVFLSGKYMDFISILTIIAIPVIYLPVNLSYTARLAYLGSFLISRYNELPLIFWFCLSAPLLFLLVFSGLEFIKSRFNIKRLSLLSGAGMILVLAALVFSTQISVNKQERNVLKIFQAGFRNDGAEVIRLERDQLFIDKMMQFEINRALYKTGHLLDSLFNYPQQFAEKGIFLEDKTSSRVALHISNFYYDLGFALEARHWATEAQMVLMRHPVVLKNLVMTYIAVGNTEIAQKYLRILSGSWLYRDWSNKILEMIESNTSGDNAAINSFRINNPKTDYFAETSNPTRKLMNFYSSNPDNKMAFEFLVASYLLQHQVGNVLIHLPGFRKFGYEKIQRAVEEAMLIYLARTQSDKLSIPGYPISQETMNDFMDFNKRMLSSERKSEQMRNVAKYKNTYWYYILFSSPYNAVKK